jgi:hypothetical protein
VPANTNAGSLLGTVFSAVDWCAPVDIAVRPYWVDRIVPGVPSGGADYAVPLEDGHQSFTKAYNPPMPVVAYMGGVTLSASSSQSDFNPT